MHLIVTQPAESTDLPWNKLKRQAQRIGHHIEQQGDRIEKVICELPIQPLAVKLVKAAGGTGDNVTLMARPEACIEEMLCCSARQSEKNVKVWCVSNLFFEKNLAPHLHLAEEDTVELEGIQAQCCCLIALKPATVTDLPVKVATVIPSSALPKTFIVETEDGIEQRDRPAYYYTQAGVIPWRVTDDQLQVMLITSSKNRHWGFPKGVMEPGEPPEYTAEIEAREEGGILGDIGISIGQFEVPKWGASCTVETFAMKVTEVLPKTIWQESHRNRHWCNLSLARGLVKNKGFIELLDKLEELYQKRGLEKS